MRPPAPRIYPRTFTLYEYSVILFCRTILYKMRQKSNSFVPVINHYPRKRPFLVAFLIAPLYCFATKYDCTWFIVSRTTAIGVLYLLVICVLPIILNTHMGLPVAIGGTSVLIVAGVVLDTMNQVQSYLVAKQYSGAIKKAGKKGRFRN